MEQDHNIHMVSLIWGTFGSKSWENSLKFVSVSPNSRSVWAQFSNMLKIAWVAQALLMTCRRNNFTNIYFIQMNKTNNLEFGYDFTLVFNQT